MVSRSPLCSRYTTDPFIEGIGFRFVLISASFWLRARESNPSESAYEADERPLLQPASFEKGMSLKAHGRVVSCRS